MNVFELTRALVDIESITGNEEQVGAYLCDLLAPLAERHGGHVERMPVEPRRFNVLAWWGDTPAVTLSTHMDTVPPFFPSREDDGHIYGRAASDTKGIIASMVKAAEALLESGKSNFGLLFVVGEERNSAGAYRAAEEARGSRYLINGEPTENRLALGSKGALRYEIEATGRMAHSAYPELGEIRHSQTAGRAGGGPGASRCLWMKHSGPGTLNIGTIAGGRAPNVIPDSARAEVMIRLVNDSAAIRAAMARAAEGKAEARAVLEIPALRLGSLPGMETTVVAYTTDIPAFGGAWGRPFLIGPGSIHVAHTLEERVPKAQLEQAVAIYQNMVARLLAE